LGLLNRSYETDAAFDPSGQKTQWERFAHLVTSLNAHASPGTQYKVLYLARHGEAYHNVAQSYYGVDCWECYWSQQQGNGTVTWADAELTPKGVAQVTAANLFWKNALTSTKPPMPQSFYVSPMARCLNTANTTWGDIPGEKGHTFSPTVKELLREPLNACTCGWRHSKSWIHELYPSYVLEQGFSEEDNLWKAGFIVESSTGLLARVKTLLDDVFASDSNTFISFTTHGVVINPLLQIIGHPNPAFNVTAGQIIPVLIKAQENTALENVSATAPPSAAKTCLPCSSGKVT
ncbi:histidine phosphatase superfamily, partial [Immersiella caudata]